jgi:integrase
MQVLSRVLSHAVDPLGQIAGNPCEGIKRLYNTDRSEIIWTDADIAELKAACSPELANAIDLAAHTGLRLGDLIRLAWAHIGDDAIVLRTGNNAPSLCRAAPSTTYSENNAPLFEYHIPVPDKPDF